MQGNVIGRGAPKDVSRSIKRYDSSLLTRIERLDIDVEYSAGTKVVILPFETSESIETMGEPYIINKVLPSNTIGLVCTISAQDEDDNTYRLNNMNGGYMEGWFPASILIELSELNGELTSVNNAPFGAHCAQPQTTAETSQQLKTTEGNNSMKANVSTQINQNKSAAILAAEIITGKLLNKKAIKVIAPKVPVLLRPALKGPFGSLILANVVGMALKHFAGSHEKAGKVGDLMLQAAALQVAEEFSVEEILESLLDGITLPEGDDGKE